MHSDGIAEELARTAGSVTIGGFVVPRIGFGAMRLPGDPARADVVLAKAVDLGVRLIDTAEFYGDANSAIARSLRPYRDDLLIATKAGPRRGARGIVAERDAAGIVEGVHANLRHLGLDALDLVHARKMPGLPFELLVETLIGLREQGLVRNIGVSNVTLADLRLALSMTAVLSVQNPYSIFDRGDDDVVDLATRLGIAYLPYFPLGAGATARPVRALHDLAAAVGATPAQYAIAWLLRRSPIMVPIPGTGSIAHLEENIRAASVRLPQD